MELGIAGVHHLENPVRVLVKEFAFGRVVAFPKVITLTNCFCKSGVAFDIVWDCDPVFDEISLLDITLFQDHGFVVGVVVLSVGGRYLVETFNQHS